MSFDKRKLKRELKRPVDQLRAALLYPFEIYWKYAHDRDFHTNIRMTNGEQPVDRKVAIYLIYQPKKLAESTLVTCKHLQRHGYAVLLVSNTALSEESKQRLKPVTWKIMERPNFGYDFGGYRDGVRFIQDSDLSLDAMVILNDSMWWPVFENDTTLARMERSQHDLMGMIIRPFGKRRKAMSERPQHLQSYFYWFNAKAISSKAFRDFWDHYLPSSFKYNAIRRGELKFTEAMKSGGLSIGTLIRFDDFFEALRQKPSDYLNKVLGYAAYKNAAQTAQSHALQTATTKDDVWRENVFEFINHVEATSEFHMSFQVNCMDLLGLNHTKRSSGEPKDSPHHVARDQFLKAVENADLPGPIPLVLAEIEERHRIGAQAVGR